MWYLELNISLNKLDPFISIIIPTKNSERYIKNCLTSILAQTFDDYEIIIKDAQSSDDTLKIIKSFNDERIKLFSEADSGIYDAMNKGIKVARGNWLYFLGSDDEIHNNSVFKNIFEFLNSSSSMIVYGNVVVNGDAGWALDGQIYDGNFSKCKIIAKNICHQSIFYHKKVFEKMGLYDTNYPICADHEFNIRSCSIFKFEFINIIVANFKGGGLSSHSDNTFVSDFHSIVLKHHPYLVHKLNIANIKIQEEANHQMLHKNFIKSLYLYATLLYKKTIYKAFLILGI